MLLIRKTHLRKNTCITISPFRETEFRHDHDMLLSNNISNKSHFSNKVLEMRISVWGDSLKHPEQT